MSTYNYYRYWMTFIASHPKHLGCAVGHLVEAVCYKLKGNGFVFQWCHWDYSLT